MYSCSLTRNITSHSTDEELGGRRHCEANWAIYPTLTPAHRPNRFTPRAFNFKCTPAALPEILRHTVLMKNLAFHSFIT